MSFGRFEVDWERRIDIDRMRKERLERARRAASQRGVSAMLLLHGDNTRYLGHNLPKAMTQAAGGFRFMLFPIKHQPVLYEYGMWRPFVKDGVDWLEVKRAASIVAQGPPEARQAQFRKAAGQIKKEMLVNGLKDEKLLLDVYNLGLVRALEAEGVKVELGAQESMTDARRIKTGDEQECLRYVASIVEGGFEKLRESIRPGVSENELRGIFVGELYRLGMEYVPSGEIVTGPRTYINSVTTSDRIVRNGDIVIAMGCQSSYLGYRACYYRTYVCGRANREQKDCFSSTRDILYDAIKTVKPGATTKDVAEKWPKASEFGYEDEDEALWIQWGHGIGLSGPEEPTASRLWSMDHPQRYEEGMTLALEDWLPTKERSGTYPKGQSVRLEEMLAVTSSGTDLFSKYPIDELIECTG